MTLDERLLDPEQFEVTLRSIMGQLTHPEEALNLVEAIRAMHAQVKAAKDQVAACVALIEPLKLHSDYFETPHTMTSVKGRYYRELHALVDAAANLAAAAAAYRAEIEKPLWDQINMLQDAAVERAGLRKERDELLHFIQTDLNVQIAKVEDAIAEAMGDAEWDGLPETIRLIAGQRDEWRARAAQLEAAARDAEQYLSRRLSGGYFRFTGGESATDYANSLRERITDLERQLAEARDMARAPVVAEIRADAVGLLAENCSSQEQSALHYLVQLLDKMYKKKEGL